MSVLLISSTTMNHLFGVPCIFVPSVEPSIISFSKLLSLSYMQCRKQRNFRSHILASNGGNLHTQSSTSALWIPVVKGTLSDSLHHYISTVSTFLCSTRFIIKAPHPCIATLNTRAFNSITLVSIDRCL